ncbi:DinB family protein [Methylocaldum gracile]|jgi:uncharacterized damage-inducible protein DinB|uniref:DinB family protein n=1 Tax=unclassified Methylocaldum TaxID=2622260 RepID=UPI001060D296
MYELSYYETMAEYNAWMNEKLYRVCAEIPDELRKKDLGAFFGSIHGTLNHLLHADLIWMGRLAGQPLTTAALGQELYSAFDDLRRERETMDRKILDWTRTLSPERLAQPFTYTSLSDRKTRTRPFWLLVAHLFNHQTHHRGQLTTLLSQLGLDYGVTDLPWLPSLCELDPAEAE